MARTEGRNIFTAYDGQSAAYEDQIYHFGEDGLMVRQFGNLYPYAITPTVNAYLGQAENIRSLSTVSINGDVYAYTNDEGHEGPIQRMHLQNLDSIHEFAASGAMGSAMTLSLSQLF